MAGEWVMLPAPHMACIEVLPTWNQPHPSHAKVARMTRHVVSSCHHASQSCLVGSATALTDCCIGIETHSYPAAADCGSFSAASCCRVSLLPPGFQRIFGGSHLCTKAAIARICRDGNGFAMAQWGESWHPTCGLDVDASDLHCTCAHYRCCALSACRDASWSLQPLANAPPAAARQTQYSTAELAMAFTLPPGSHVLPEVRMWLQQPQMAVHLATAAETAAVVAWLSLKSLRTLIRVSSNRRALSLLGVYQVSHPSIPLAYCWPPSVGVGCRAHMCMARPGLGLDTGWAHASRNPYLLL